MKYIVQILSNIDNLSLDTDKITKQAKDVLVKKFKDALTSESNFEFPSDHPIDGFQRTQIVLVPLNILQHCILTIASEE